MSTNHGTTGSTPVEEADLSIPLRDVDSIDTERVSVGDLVKNAATQVSTLVRAEIELAKTELTDQAKKAGTGALLFIVAAVLGLLSLLPFIFMWAKLISLWLGTKSWDWAGFLIVFVVLLILAGILVLMGTKKVKKVGKPQRTIDSVNDLKTVLPGQPGHSAVASRDLY